MRHAPGSLLAPWLLKKQVTNSLKFALEGCRRIAISDINLTGLHETAKYMKEVSSDVDILVNQVDTQEEVQIEDMVQATVAKFGRVDYAVNCAGEQSILFL
jgi:NAD(P)-dependent dehydrogenase (short-subunit alcohol dehydrogenase family)